MKKTIDEIKKEATEKMTKLINDFCDDISNGTQSIDKFMNINDIDERWTGLQCETSEVYEKIVGELINAVSETTMIAKKKENIEKIQSS